MRIAIMQPYFWPYAGYYRLLAGADTFVIFDCVQHIRRGRIHRNEFSTEGAGSDWLTLPLARAQQTARIDTLRFAPDTDSEFPDRLRRFPLAQRAFAEEGLAAPVAGGSVAEWLAMQLGATAGRLGLACRIRRSSALAVDDSLRGTERILAVCRALGADRYLNLPGGVGLYDPGQFAAQGVSLQFLPAWNGSMQSLTERLLGERTAALRDEICTGLPA